MSTTCGQICPVRSTRLPRARRENSGDLSLGLGGTAHEVREHELGLQPVMHDLHHLLGDGHLDTVRHCESKGRLAAVDSLTGTGRGIDGLRDGQSAPEVRTEGAIPRQR